MAITRVGGTTSGRGGAGTVTLSRSTAAGNLLIATIQHQNGNVATVTDDAAGGSNTWVAAGDTLSAGATSQRLVAIYYCLNAKAITALTVTGTTVIQVLLDEWAGAGVIGATPAVASRASSTTPAAATVTGVTSGDLVYGCLAYLEAVAGTALETLTAGYTTTAHFDNSGASTTAVAGGYSLTASGTTGPTWTMSSAASTGEVTVTFKPAAALPELVMAPSRY